MIRYIVAPVLLRPSIRLPKKLRFVEEINSTMNFWEILGSSTSQLSIQAQISSLELTEVMFQKQMQLNHILRSLIIKVEEELETVRSLVLNFEFCYFSNFHQSNDASLPGKNIENAHNSKRIRVRNKIDPSMGLGQSPLWYQAGYWQYKQIN